MENDVRMANDFDEDRNLGFFVMSEAWSLAVWTSAGCYSYLISTSVLRASHANITALTPGHYGLLVTAYDPSNNYCSTMSQTFSRSIPLRCTKN
jgi:hypothetical protein